MKKGNFFFHTERVVGEKIMILLVRICSLTDKGRKQKKTFEKGGKLLISSQRD